MADAIVLIGGYLKRSTGFSNQGFNNKSGFLIKFTLNNINYIHVNQVDLRTEDQNTVYITAGYYDEVKFLDYLAKKIPVDEISKYKLNLSPKKDGGYLEDGVVGDTILVRKLYVVSPYTDFCNVIDATWIYNGDKLIDDAQLEIIIPDNAKKDINPVTIDPKAQEFYQRNITLVNVDGFLQKDESAYALALIALQINNIQKNIFPIFSADPVFKTYIDNQIVEWASGEIFTTPSLQDFQNYLKDISEFYRGFYSNQVFIKAAKNDTKLYYLAYVLSISALGVVPVSDKIRILNEISAGYILGVVSSLLPYYNEEEFVIKVVKSVIAGQEDDFLNGLINTKSLDGGANVTLFQVLYDRVNDVGLGFGVGNLKQLMDELYKLWVRSIFFPYNLDGSVKDNLINPAVYRSKPIVLGYEAGTVLWAFNKSNYHFSFNNSKIDVNETKYDVMEQLATSYEELIGSYDIFQTITIKNTDSNTNNTRFISVNIDGNSQAALPIFYLKYIDDRKDTENLETVLELVVDIALIDFEVVNLLKLRHVLQVGRLWRIVRGLEVAADADVIVTFELDQGIAGAINVTGAVAQLFIKYSQERIAFCTVGTTGYNKDECEYYTWLDNFFTVMQLFSGAVDIVTSRQLKSYSEKLLANPKSSELDEEALSLLKKFAGDNDAMSIAFGERLIERYGNNESVIWQKLSKAGQEGEFTIAQRDEFVLDFEKATDEVLDAMNENEGDLINYWVLCEDFENDRKLPDFLIVAKRVYSEARIDNHFLALDFTTLANGKIIIKGGHQEKSMAAALQQGYQLIITELDDIGKDYRIVKVGVVTPSLKIGKKTKSTLLPDYWEVKKIKGEITYALHRIQNPTFVDPIDNRTLYTSYFSDGRQVTIILIRDNSGKIVLDNILIDRTKM